MPSTFKKDNLTVLVFDDRQSLGAAAALMISDKIKSLLVEKEFINMIFAAAPSQNEVLAALRHDTTIPWQRINAYHMDEYLGLDADAPQLFGVYLKSRLFTHLPFRSVNYINPPVDDPQKECHRYSHLLQNNPPDIVCMGIGENTHLAFNDPHKTGFRDPHKADFDDPARVKLVSLDLVCRQQQVNDGCFAGLSEVPEYALTLTIPALLSAPFIYCMVPGKTKASAIRHTLTEPVTAAWPSTILRTHPDAILFVDGDSYGDLKNEML